MDQVKVNTARSAVPAWARADERTRELNGEPPASQSQLNYISSLLVQRDLSGLKPEEREALERVQKEKDFWSETTTRLTKAKAGRILDRIIPLPNKPREQQDTSSINAERFAVGVPAGRYAVDSDSGELRFYHVWVSRDKKRLNVYVVHGPDESDLKYQKTVMGILKKIKKDIRGAAIRYGMEIGECSNCGRRLTNRISRELSIGPICGGRMFGEAEWKLEVKAKRAEIIARGDDPDEELE